MHKRMATIASFMLVSLLALIIAPRVYAQYTPDVFVIDQEVVDGTVTITRATINGPGWMVIHAQQDGNIGPVIGYTAVTAGINARISVTLDEAGVTDTLYAMLHVDDGVVGEYEFDGKNGLDAPLMVNDQMITPAFQVTGKSITLVGAAMAAGNLNTLVEAIKAADLVKELKGDGPFTLYAPTDEAFAALPAGTLDDPEKLKSILLYHLLPSQLMVADVISDGLEIATVNGALIKITLPTGKVMINDATVVQADVAAKNGVIHIIDKVLIPPVVEEAAAAEAPVAEASSAVTETVAMTETVMMTETMAMTETAMMTETAVMTETMAESAAMTETMAMTETAMMTETAAPAVASSASDRLKKALEIDIIDATVAAGNFKTLLTALDATGLSEVLKGDGPFTVFAPTDEAFAALPEGALDGLLKDPDQLKSILLYHVVAGAVMAADVSDGLETTTLNGETVKFAQVDGKTLINDATITQADLTASNGVIHAIDKVLLPGAEEAMATEAPAAEAPTAEAPVAEAPAVEAPAPTELPVTGSSNLGSATLTLSVVLLVLACLAATTLVTKRREV